MQGSRLETTTHHARLWSEEKLRGFLDAAPDSMVIIDEAGTIVLVNAQAEATFGYPRTQLLGSPVEVLLPERFRASHVAHRGAYLHVPLTRPMGVDLELAGRRSDGTEFPVDISLSPLRTEDGVLVTAAIRDISERKRAERTLEFTRRIAMAANRASDIDEALAACLGEVCGFLGFPLGHAHAVADGSQRLVPTGIWHLDAADTLSAFRDATMRSAFPAGPGSIPGLVLEAKRPVWFDDLARVEASPGRLAAGADLRVAFALPVLAGAEVTHVLEFFHRDATEPQKGLLDVLEQVGTQLGRVIERVRAQRQRLHAEALERSNRELRLFAHVASHDLQEPLRMVTSFLELLRERYSPQLDSRGVSYVAHAVDGAQRMQALIRSLLEYSRLDTRSNVLTRTDSAAVLEQALQNLRRAVRESSAVVTRTPNLPHVLGDETQLVQLFQNLIGNSIKFCRETPEVEVSVVRNGLQWRFSVRDNGIGIDPVHADRIFEVFQRLHTREEYPGTGIGLAICKRIVQRHGGRLWVESAPGGGSVFHFLLPDGSAGGDE